MKLHYSKILLLFFLTLTILLILCHAHNNNNEPHSTPRLTPTTTSRVLSECDKQSSIYNNDADIESVKEIFDRQTSQRFEEYEERMKDKSQKRKEERYKNIQKIIEKDKMEKSLAEKVEKGCLRCGCALGGVAASVGIFGSVAANELTKVAMTAAITAAKEAGAAAGKIVGDTQGMNIVIFGLNEFGIKELCPDLLQSIGSKIPYTNAGEIADIIIGKYKAGCSVLVTDNPMCTTIGKNFNILTNRSRTYLPTNDGIRRGVNKIVEKATSSAKAAADIATKEATEAAIKTSTEAIETTSYNFYAAIGYSVLAILIIVLVMIIIYLVLRYRRKNKMNKKSQYTKLLNQ